MKVNETYTETYPKHHEIEIEGTKKALENEALCNITIQKRGMCLKDGKACEFMQMTAYWDTETQGEDDE